MILVNIIKTKCEVKNKKVHIVIEQKTHKEKEKDYDS